MFNTSDIEDGIQMNALEHVDSVEYPTQPAMVFYLKWETHLDFKNNFGSWKRYYSNYADFV